MEERILFSLDEDLKEKLTKMAQSKGLSVSGFLRMIIIEKLEENFKNKAVK